MHIICLLFLSSYVPVFRVDQRVLDQLTQPAIIDLTTDKHHIWTYTHIGYPIASWVRLIGYRYCYICQRPIGVCLFHLESLPVPAILVECKNITFVVYALDTIDISMTRSKQLVR